MGISRTGAEFADKFAQVPRAMELAQREAARQVAKAGQEIVLDKARMDNKGTLRWRNVGKRGTEIRATATASPAGNGREVITVRPRGNLPWAVLEKGRRSYVVTSRYAGGTRKSRQQRVEAGQPLQKGGGRGGKAVLNIPGMGRRRWVRIPAMRGKKTFTVGTEKFYRVAPEIARREHAAALRDIFR
jgi:hypothetical protein